MDPELVVDILAEADALVLLVLDEVDDAEDVVEDEPLEVCVADEDEVGELLPVGVRVNVADEEPELVDEAVAEDVDELVDVSDAVEEAELE